MPLYIGDYLADTTHLTADQHGAYMLLLMAAWKSGGKLPNDDEQLQAITKLSDERWKKSKSILFAFFLLEDCFLIHRRLLSELEKASALSEKRRAAGKTGGRPKTPKPEEKKQNESKTKTSEKQNSKQNETPSPSPSHIDLSNDKSEKTLSEASSASDRFEIFWEFARGEYKKLDHPTGAKAEALEAFKKLRPDDQLCKRMCESLRAQVAAKLERARLGHDSAQLKHVCRWISKSCYDDDPDPVPAGQAAIGRGGLAPAQRSLHSFDNVDYSKGVNPDGSF